MKRRAIESGANEGERERERGDMSTTRDKARGDNRAREIMRERRGNETRKVIIQDWGGGCDNYSREVADSTGLSTTTRRNCSCALLSLDHPRRRVNYSPSQISRYVGAREA